MGEGLLETGNLREVGDKYNALKLQALFAQKAG
jgi:hypothetical protein